MNRFKRHKVKQEKSEPSASYSREAEEHDLAYYIHDRVELMHQVFSVLKHKELRAMAPECVRHISIDDLQELCTEELLGISSKRLCATLDGAEPPSDTESSSQSEPEQLETISLDSISSDEEILSQTGSKKKKHKHRHRNSKSKTKKRRTKSKEPDVGEDAEQSKASRAGLTVLELLELQARARAIRAQLQQEQANKQPAEPTPVVDHESGVSENEVEIKEEPPEVVEISSDEEKPKIEELEKALPKADDDRNKNEEGLETANNISEKSKDTNRSKEKKNKKDKSKKDKKKEKQKKDSEEDKNIDSQKDQEDLEKDNNDLIQTIAKAKNKSSELDSEKGNTQKVTKKINDLIITVPQQHSRKIKLNRNKVTISIANTKAVANNSKIIPEKITNEIREPADTAVKSTVHIANKPKEKVKDKSKKKHKRKEKKKSSDEDGSDHDEITLQLSDSEKMDLLEDFDRRNLDNVTSSSEASESSSESDNDTSQDSSKETTIETPQNPLVENVDDSGINSNGNKHLDKNIENNLIELEDDENNTQDTEKSTSKEVCIHTEDSKTCTSNNEKCKYSKSFQDKKEMQPDSVNDLQAANSDITTASDKTDTLNKVESFISPNDSENILVINNINDIPVREDIQESQDNYTDNEKTKIIQIGEISETAEKSRQIADKTDALNKVEGFISPSGSDNILIIQTINDIPVREDIQESKDRTDNENLKMIEIDEISETAENSTQNEAVIELSQKPTESCFGNKQNESVVHADQIDNDIESNTTQNNTQNLSDGEVSSNESSEVEARELKPEVVCISDEESDSSKPPKKKKHKKKEKKSKKEKRAKKSKSDFREGADQNFYRDVDIHVVDKEEDIKVSSDSKEYVSLIDDDEVYEILELSDDSSCYEVEGTVLSKEPTAEEIEALSAKIDQIEREDVITEEQIREHGRRLMETSNNYENNLENDENSENNIERISWKDRYLGSKKVKTVLTTSNILNALRKKNKELKKKLQESKKKEELVEKPTDIPVQLEEGSIEHYNTLEGSTTYVNPVPDPVTENKEMDESIETQENKIDKINIEIQVTGEMKKDAKQLLKMYKKLLKYNDMTKPKDPNKKKKKKRKKKENDVHIVASKE